MCSAHARRERDADVARLAFLDAAEEVFAQNGFDGARVDAIAAVAGYNKSLIFQYFDDKLGLYAEVLKRTDREMTGLQLRLLGPLLAQEDVGTDARRLRALLETITAGIFDYLLEHPRFLRMLLWEMAEGWKSYAKIIAQFPTDDIDPFEAVFRIAWSAGLLRSDFSTLVQITMILQICQSFIAFLPLYQMLVPGGDMTTSAALARVKEYIVGFVVAGMMVDSPGAKL